LLLIRAFRFRRRSIFSDGSGQTLKLVLLQTAAIGDTLLMAGAIRRLRACYPQARIVLALGSDNIAAVPLLPSVDEVVLVPVFRPWRALKILRALRADLLIDYGTWPRINAVLTALSGARFTVGFRTPGQYRHFAYDQAVEHSAECHELANQQKLLEFLPRGGRELTWDSRIELSELGGSEAESGKNGLATEDSIVGTAGESLLPKSPFLVFHAWASGSGKRLKEWPTSYWQELARWAHERSLAMVLTGGPGDRVESEALAREIARAVPGSEVVSLAGRCSLVECARILLRARATVSVNTGIMHLSALLGVPTVGLHGPTNPRRWGPVGARIAALAPQDNSSCGYLNLGFEFPDHPAACMEEVKPEAVIEALFKLPHDAGPRS
jgi:ADP-heptose:LPS heptosyltransferase